MASDQFTMADLLDYEAQMARDSIAEPTAIQERDKALRAIVIPDDKRQSLLAWVRFLKNRQDSWPGAPAERSYDVLAFVAIVLGILSGTGLIQAMLHYDGSQPVNVIPFLGVYALLQIILLLNYIFKATVYRLFKKLPGGALIFLIREAAERWTQRHGGIVASGSPTPAAVKDFTDRLAQLHRSLLQNHAWKIVQDFGIACHGASLITFISLLFFNDYTFGWRTTLQLEPELLHRITSLLALPFAWIGDFASPSMELIQKSQFSRFQKGFVLEGLDHGARATAAWWPFLASVIAVYGLIPRIVIWILLRMAIKKELAHLPFHDFRSEALWNRLREEKASWTTGSLESPKPPSDQKLYQHTGKEQRDCVVLRWRDLPLSDLALKELFGSEFALTPIRFINARGLSTDVDAIIESLGQQRDRILVIASDPWELPGEALEKIRASIRERVSKSLLILFAPVEDVSGRAQLSPSRNKNAWSHAIAAYRDPYMGLLETEVSL